MSHLKPEISQVNGCKRLEVARLGGCDDMTVSGTEGEAKAVTTGDGPDWSQTGPVPQLDTLTAAGHQAGVITAPG